MARVTVGRGGGPRARWVMAIFACLLAGPAVRTAGAADAIGVVRLAEGAAVIRRSGRALPAVPGLAMLESDTLETGRDGRLGVILRDDTRIALGPDSSVGVDEVRFEHRIPSCPRRTRRPSRGTAGWR